MSVGRLGPQLNEHHLQNLNVARRVTVIGMLVSALLATSKLLVGWLGHSTAVFADGLENTGDLFGSGLILYALFVASKPPDKEHPYGHGRSETIAGLAVGFLLAASGLAICYVSFRRLHSVTEAPHLFAIWPMVASIVVKGGLSVGKLSYGKRLGSAALQADAAHDGIEIVSGIVALLALSLTLYDPEHFSAADHWGGFIVGLIVLLSLSMWFGTPARNSWTPCPPTGGLNTSVESPSAYRGYRESRKPMRERPDCNTTSNFISKSIPR
jgi:cation diffusion facilitator family transporter